ncbi:heavy metal sensor histidine kinase [Citrobacter sedlakii]|uniref:heavy metal sensor histidine kinase n=1 Tax=Citrobacter TaxID=544 RepID=UPI00196A0BEE|nr:MULTISPECIES: heavy metal sensor histidine kinase [Citrobacter]MBM9568941.1 heavy metal sensor histidine kinase [Citrobacter sedlakii]HBL4690189.1 heavy metal sensor histidine kinase [Citrobacter sedlakii]HBL4704628.1 heavy metal sensor histidine kinase [Citrobacter sedlakii]HBL4719377.1 heavy metal sensor histidine kinase [Citrobacter sedlakii]HCA7840328.1 heavy metal sensor histidine kinase [Citrobacter sedlakii]
MKRELSMTLRLTLLFVLVLTLACAGVSWTLYRALSKELTWRDDITLINRAEQIRQLLVDGAKAENLPLYFNRMMDTRQDILLIHSPTSENIAVNHTGVNPAVLDALPAQQKPTLASLAKRDIAGTQLSAVRIIASSDARPVTITVARLASERQDMLEQYRNNSLAIGILAILVCSALTPFLVRRGLKAITSLSQQTANIDSRGLSQPLDENALPVELKPLGSALNVMRQKLSDDFTRLNQFADDLAHELRTPVNILLGHNQVALSKARTAEQYQHTLASNIEELEGLSRLTENILFLARAEHHTILLAKEAVAYSAVINNLVEFLEYEAEEKNIRFFVSGDATIQADRTLLQRVLMNLLSNAIHYSPAQATVEIEASGNPDQTIIEIRNPGTVALNADKLFHRFWRGDNARQSAGYGLGLSLVKAIMTLHSATVSYRFRDGKHIFALHFPA